MIKYIILSLYFARHANELRRSDYWVRRNFHIRRERSVRMRSEVGRPHMVRLRVIEKWKCKLLRVLIHHTTLFFIGKFIALIYGSKLRSHHKWVMSGVCLTNKELSGIDLDIFLFFLFWNTHSCSWRTKILKSLSNTYCSRICTFRKMIFAIRFFIKCIQNLYFSTCIVCKFKYWMINFRVHLYK